MGTHRPWCSVPRSHVGWPSPSKATSSWQPHSQGPPACSGLQTLCEGRKWPPAKLPRDTYHPQRSLQSRRTVPSCALLHRGTRPGPSDWWRWRGNAWDAQTTVWETLPLPHPRFPNLISMTPAQQCLPEERLTGKWTSWNHSAWRVSNSDLPFREPLWEAYLNLFT